jgi:hypothetical protein
MWTLRSYRRPAGGGFGHLAGREESLLQSASLVREWVSKMRIARTEVDAAAVVAAGTLASLLLVIQGAQAQSVELFSVSSPDAIAPTVKACAGPCYIRLTPGNWDKLDLRFLTPAPNMVEIDLTGSTFSFGYIVHSSNLTIIGGLVNGGNTYGQCWIIDFASGVTIRNAAATRCGSVGFGLTRSHNVKLLAWTVTAATCDGVDVSGTNGFVVFGGNFSGYVGGTACHGDGVQMWAMDGYPLQNGQVLSNTLVSSPVLAADGKSSGIQGIVDFGGAYAQDHITVTGNKMYLNGAWCVAMFDTTNLVAQNNSCVNEHPQPWPSNYGWEGSTGTIGPNLLDNVAVGAAAGSRSTSPERP